LTTTSLYNEEAILYYMLCQARLRTAFSIEISQMKARSAENLAREPQSAPFLPRATSKMSMFRESS